MKKLIFAIVALMALTAGVEANAGGAPAVPAESKSEAASLVTRIVNTLNEIAENIKGVSSQTRMQQIMESCLAQMGEITEVEAANTVLTEGDKARLSKSIGNVFVTMATNLGGAQARANADMLLSSIDTQIAQSTNLRDLFIRLNMDIFTKVTGRTNL